MPRACPLLPKCPTDPTLCGDTQMGIPMMPDGGTQSRFGLTGLSRHRQVLIFTFVVVEVPHYTEDSPHAKERLLCGLNLSDQGPYSLRRRIQAVNDHLWWASTVSPGCLESIRHEWWRGTGGSAVLLPRTRNASGSAPRQPVTSEGVSRSL
jgi:hypothetical protein